MRKLTKAEREILESAARRPEGAAESYYSFSGARTRIIARLIGAGLLVRREERLARSATTRLVITDAGREALAGRPA